MSSVDAFKKELHSLGEKLSASKIQNLTKMAIKMSLKYADQVAGCIEDYITVCSMSSRLGALSVVDSICRGASKLHDKDPSWDNVYYKILPERLAPLFPTLFDCPEKDKEKMKRIVGFWMQSDKLFPTEFATTAYRDYFENTAQGTPARSGPPPSPKPSTSARLKSSGVKEPSLDTSLPPAEVPAAPSANSALPVSSSTALPTLSGLTSGTLGLSGLTGQSSILSLLGGNQSISIGLPGATPSTLVNLLPSAGANAQSNGGPNHGAGFQSGDPRSHYSSHDDRQSFHNSSDPRMRTGSYSSDPRSQHQDPRAQSQQFQNQDPRAAPDDRYGGRRDDPRHGSYGREGYGQQPGRFDSQRANGGDGRYDGRADPRDANSRPGEFAHPDRAGRSDYAGGSSSNTAFQQRRGAPLAPGPDSEPSYEDTSVPIDSIKIISRTLFVSGFPPTMTQYQLKELLETARGRVETIRVNNVKANAFVKMATRKEAEQTREAFQGFQIEQGALKIGWACGYGPKENFSFTDGVTFYSISKIPDQERSYIESSYPRGGGSIKGGTVMEEPNVPVDLAMSSRGSARSGAERGGYEGAGAGQKRGPPPGGPYGDAQRQRY
ncbi:hypothetical protein HDV03_003780 [Kappamyces sp. JEL0829]|nr:hypothetical protein HDV03_003780 [Kappamyces sp. JEL0829]